jgi:hypothetical protein
MSGSVDGPDANQIHRARRNRTRVAVRTAMVSSVLCLTEISKAVTRAPGCWCQWVPHLTKFRLRFPHCNDDETLWGLSSFPLVGVTEASANRG